jgi:hypothetical protein
MACSMIHWHDGIQNEAISLSNYIACLVIYHLIWLNLTPNKILNLATVSTFFFSLLTLIITNISMVSSQDDTPTFNVTDPSSKLKKK